MGPEGAYTEVELDYPRAEPAEYRPIICVLGHIHGIQDVRGLAFWENHRGVEALVVLSNN